MGAPMKTMKAMKGSKKAVTSMGKGAIAAALAEEHGLKKAVCSKIMNTLAALAATEVKKDWKVRHPRCDQVADPREACYQGWQEGNLWQGGDGEGQASQDDCESMPRGSYQEVHLEQSHLAPCCKVKRRRPLFCICWPWRCRGTGAAESSR